MSVLFFCLGIVYASLIEYLIHKYVYHKSGKNRFSFFSHHLKVHHKRVKKNNFIDKSTARHEYIGMLILIAIHIPVWFFNVYLFMGIMIYSIIFIVLHDLQHRNPAFCKKYTPWHWRHHMENPNKDWNVVLPIWDFILDKR